MKKWLSLCGMFLMASCSRSNADYNQFVKQSNAYMLQKIDKCVEDYKISDYKRFDWNQQTGAYGEKHQYEKLTKPGWTADEADGWDMAAVTANILQSKGVYKAPDSSGNGFTFLVIQEIDWAKKK
jgi:hypothetical protein